MTDSLFETPAKPVLPEPHRKRWQPLRIGLVELFHYDSEEFWFRDGHLLLRGNNGTGKSKVLSLTLPLLFDANLRSGRVEPDGDNGKKMAWNLLVGQYPRRIGYSWIEFGRLDQQGIPHYLTLGVGLLAVAGKPQMDSWFFLLEGDADTPAPRLGQNLWLTNEQRSVLTRDRLSEAIAGRGQIFPNGHNYRYRRAVDERLFNLGPRRYDALMDTLIQLRQPQLSKKPDETGLSNALSESLPPLPTELLGDVAEALNQLEEDRNQLEEARRLEQATSQFERRYRRYSGMLARRQARELRQAQTAFDNASDARNRAQAAFAQAQVQETTAQEALENAKQAHLVARERLETLQSDPANQDANRLTQAGKDADQRQREVGDASKRHGETTAALQREAERSRQRGQFAESTRTRLAASRSQTQTTGETIGLTPEIAANPLLGLALEELAETGRAIVEEAGDALRKGVFRRRQDIVHLRQRHADVDRHQTLAHIAQDERQASRSALGEALEQRENADRHAEIQAGLLVDQWAGYCTGLQQLRFDTTEPLQRLADWAARPAGDNPAREALGSARQTTLHRHVTRQAELESRRAALQLQRATLESERERLTAGEDAAPLAPTTRSPTARIERQGAPLWQLVDFQLHLSHAEHAGLEAALEASGLLDAWLAPDGSLHDAAGQPLLDGSWLQRMAVPNGNLNDVLIPALPDACPVTAETLNAVLAGVSCGVQDPGHTESWVAPDGRFRLGALAGAWTKPEATYIGHTAREQARWRRLEQIATELALLDGADAELAGDFATLADARLQADQEWQGAPTDRPLLDAIAAATAAGTGVRQAQQALDRADERHRDAEAKLKEARERLHQDAADLQLPPAQEQLPSFEQALETFDQAQRTLWDAVRDWRRAWPDCLEQQQREDEARAALEQAHENLALAEERAAQAHARFETLREAVGQQVDALLQKLAQANEARRQAETALEHAAEARRRTGERRAVTESEIAQKEQILQERSEERAKAIERLRRFAASGLLASALPDLVLPDTWSIDPALNLARRVEQELSQVADDDNAWNRVQQQIAEDLTELQRALSALGHQAMSEPNDWGFSVHIQYRNRAESPANLAALLAEDIAQRSELLSAREREVLENHLQAEIAAEIQRLMRNADERVQFINQELHKRPTTTGVRYRLQWEPLTLDEGAPAGLEIARTRLLNTSADLWSLEDRRVVGVMLQQQIAAERARADADATGSNLVDQLARALDYRHWHRFRIQRQQDGQWRKLSGPASSGERALGLTVPLFAAISSFYSHGGSPLAPRLMLLDEAFAGIDDTARAHCMGLIREFDLDFVITSEREWACYAELPGVSICQLQRREGIDAVFVSRWAWDGREKRIEDDPDRRFPPS